jgi:16S rRNA (adenine1518-N6/adenine1519-N6)-dimethyltransferase
VSLDPTSVDQLTQAFAELKKPRDLKKFGQNFLMDRKVLAAVVAASELTNQDHVLEIGSGSGVLTAELVKHAKRVVALEIDPYMIEVTKMAVGEAPNLELRFEDVRKVNLPKLFCEGQQRAGDYVVVANLPYYLTGYVLELLFSSACSPKRTVLMLQKEVAQRLLATPGDMSVLSVSVQVFGKVSLVTEVLSESFWPQPEVDSAVVRIDRHPSPTIASHERDHFFRVVKAGFSAKRKKLVNALAGGLHLEPDMVQKLLNELKWNPNARAQELSIDQWALLSQKIPKAQ